MDIGWPVCQFLLRARFSEYIVRGNYLNLIRLLKEETIAFTRKNGGNSGKIGQIPSCGMRAASRR